MSGDFEQAKSRVCQSEGTYVTMRPLASSWEQRKLGELFVESDERSSTEEILSVSVANGIYPASESERDTNPGASIANYKIVRVGDIVYNSMRMWQGAVGSSRYNGIVSPAYVVAKPVVELDSPCFGYLLKRPELLYKYLCNSQGNSKDTQTLRYERFAEITAEVPSTIEEQRAISDCLEGLDHLITLHQRKCQYRSLCGHLSWEQRKFSDMYVVNNERNANCELGYDRTLSIATMTFNGGNGAADDSLSNYKVIRVGDIAFEGHTNKAHAYGRFVLNDAGDGLMSPRFSCLRPIVEQRYSFWKYYIPREESMRSILVNATKSGTMMNELVPDDLMHESILVPCLAEQEVIGNSLSQLDHLITLHQRMCSIFCFCTHGSRTNFASILQG